MQELESDNENAEQLFQEATKLVEQNPDEALKLFRRAADLGHEKARNDISWMYQQGLVTFSLDFAPDYEDDVEKRQIPEAIEYIGRLLKIIEKNKVKWWGYAYLNTHWYTLDKHNKTPEFCDD